MKKTKPTIMDLTLEQQSALQEFKAKNGPEWKQILMEGWMIAKYPGPLQQIRNNFGPSWLERVQL
jgi:hypothetical protein